MKDERARTEDPYAADSDTEYEALEADRINEGESLDDEAMTARDVTEAAPERAYPDAEETAAQSDELRAMLQGSVNRDPESQAADQSRRRSDDPKGDLSPEARRLFDRTTEIRADDLDMEDLTD